MNDKYIAQAATQEEAILKGLNALGITKDEANITVEEPGKRGFLGIGQKDAVVIVERKEKLNVVDDFLSSEFDINRGQHRRYEEQSEEAVEVKEVPERELEGAAYADEVSNDVKEIEAKEQEAEMDQAAFIRGREQADVEIIGDAGVAQEYDQEVDTPESSEPDEADVYDKDQAAIEEVREYLQEIVVAMGVEDAEVYTSRVKDQVKYDIETENAGLVIGRHGKVLNGLQTLAQNHMHQLAHSKINVRADAEKYRERRKSTVENLANRTAEKVLKTNRAVKLDPMPAHERKQIHRYLNRNSKVKTHSEGREPKRYLVVEPEEE